MSITGQAARDGFKDQVLKIIEKRVQTVSDDYRYTPFITIIEIKAELLRVKKEIMKLSTD